MTEHTDHTCTATFPLYTWDDAPAGTLTLQLTIVYLACVPDPRNLQAARTTVARGTPGACPFIYLKGYPEIRPRRHEHCARTIQNLCRLCEISTAMDSGSAEDALDSDHDAYLRLRSISDTAAARIP